MKLIITLLIFHTLNLLSQVSEEWVSRYGENTNVTCESKDMVIDASGNIYVAGTKTVTGYDEHDIIVLKYNSSGVLLWDFVYNGNGNADDVANSCVLDSSGNLFVTGKSFGIGTGYDIITMMIDSSGTLSWNRIFSNGSGNTTEAGIFIVENHSNEFFVCGTGSGDLILLKYDQFGTLLWERTFNSIIYGYDDVNYLKLDHNGNIIVTGNTTDVSGWQDILLLKYSSDGMLIWSKSFGLNQNWNEYPYSCTVDDDNNIYLTGEYTNYIHSDCITLKYTPGGNLEWYRLFNGTINEIALGLDIRIDRTGNIVVAGQCLTNSLIDAVILKYNPAGELIWSKFYDEGFNEDAFKLSLDSSDNIYLLCFGQTSNYDFDYLTLKFNNSGIFQWSIKYDGPCTPIESDNPLKLLNDLSGNIYVTGSSCNPNTGYYIATIKYSQPIGIQPISSEIPELISLSQNYPNPFNPSTKIVFSIPNTSKVAHTFLNVYDMLGREITTLVNEQLSPGTYEVEWNASSYPSGLYFYTLTSGDFTETKKMILIK